MSSPKSLQIYNGFIQQISQSIHLYSHCQMSLLVHGHLEIGGVVSDCHLPWKKIQGNNTITPNFHPSFLVISTKSLQLYKGFIQQGLH